MSEKEKGAGPETGAPCDMLAGDHKGLDTVSETLPQRWTKTDRRGRFVGIWRHEVAPDCFWVQIADCQQSSRRAFRWLLPSVNGASAKAPELSRATGLPIVDTAARRPQLRLVTT